MPPAGTPGILTTPTTQREANRANWDERVPAHLRAYDADAFAADPTRITSVVTDDLTLLAPHLPTRPNSPDKPSAAHPAPGAPGAHSPVAGLDLLHLQCHIGTDTLSWARLGAHTTGLDLSETSITAARDLAARADLPVTFVTCDVLLAAHTLAGRTFDVIATSIGVLPWIADLPTWATQVAALLRPGGTFFLRDAHPLLGTIDYEDPRTATGELLITGPYFPTGTPQRYDHATTYADDAVRLSAATTYEWQHTLAEVVSAVLGAGLRLTSLTEHPVIPWRALPGMVPADDGNGYVLAEHPQRLPLTFSLTATT